MSSFEEIRPRELKPALLELDGHTVRVARDGAAAVDAKNVTTVDVVMGIAAGGTTPFVHGALRAARWLAGQKPARYTIADVMDSADKVDKQLLDNALFVHQNSGLAVLARPELPEDTQRVTQAGFGRLMGMIGKSWPSAQ